MLTNRRSFLATAVLLALPCAALARPPAPAPTPPRATPEIVAQDVLEFRAMLGRMRIYLLHAGRGARAFGDLGDGEQLWFVLPSCRPSDPDNPRRDPCPIDRLEVTAVESGGVRAGQMTTVMDGEVPRRVQAFVVADGTRLLRIRLVTPTGATRFDGVIRTSQLGDLPVPVGVARGDAYELDFGQYPGR